MTINETAYILGHEGLGDSITMIGAINFISKHYKTIYYLCKKNYEYNIKLLFDNKKVILIPYAHETQKIWVNECKNIIYNVYSNKEFDFFICGRWKKWFKSRITNPKILNYKINKNNSVLFNHIKLFYQDINLDLNIYYNYFDIKSSESSILLYNKIKDFKIIFCHTKSSVKTIILPEHITKYICLNDYIIICANENVYNKEHNLFELANKFINIPIRDYIDTIKNAYQIFLIDSCFSCITVPLSKTNKLATKNIEYVFR